MGTPTPAASGGTIGTLPTPASATLTVAESSGHTILTASAGTGGGAWTAAYASAGISLQVPSGTAYAGTNTASMTWTLFDAP